MITDCWNEIGVFGDSSCVELERYHHCTHCPIYSEGARRLLDQEPPPDYLFEWTAVLAREKEIPKQNTFAALLFRIGEHRFALSAKLFREVAEVRNVHRIPHRTNDLFRGLVNIRGTLHLCVHLAPLLKLQGEEMHSNPEKPKHREKSYARMIVVEKDSKPWVFAVDEIFSLQRFPQEEIVPMPDHEKATRGIIEWEENTFDVLDENLFFQRLEGSLE